MAQSVYAQHTQPAAGDEGERSHNAGVEITNGEKLFLAIPLFILQLTDLLRSTESRASSFNIINVRNRN